VRDAFVGKNAKAALGKPKSNRSGLLVVVVAGAVDGKAQVVADRA
jgi:uncharacterized protein (DUF1501 family)